MLPSPSLPNTNSSYIAQSRVKNRAAFTLIEITITIVIIGLLVSGIIMGKDLIRTSEFNSVIGDFNKYKIGVTIFKDRFNTLPGDMTNAATQWPNCDSPAANCNGNGDHKIYTSLETESYRAWQQLGEENLIEGKYTGKIGPYSANNSIIWC